MTWVLVSVVVVLLVVAFVGGGARRGLDRAGRSGDAERARVARELSRQIERGRDGNGWM
ncbi:hypothetical protein GCM10027586_10650 [Kineococcus gypseus]|uniref:hypothetical protein n=1 Tax=Kineococcus gypseus TaxID=1637102 RepID=UPI003D7E6E83